ncbi:MAG: hypothetical protein HY078_00810 [Elusimicrobia bacterium]|nr:hypothetical protein [Elusimicrobiota bacterium]
MSRARALRAATLAAAFGLATFLFSNTSAVLPDSAGYFAYLPSLAFDGDLQLADEFRRLNMNIPMAATVNGYAATQWPIGNALLWSPAYAAARIFAGLGAAADGHGCDGWYWRFINQGTLLYAALALALFLRAAREAEGAAQGAARAAATALCGTPLLFYALLVPSTSHGTSAFMNALVVAATLATARGGRSRARWLLLGLLCGVAALVRPQNALFSLVPLADWARRPATERRIEDAAVFVLGCAAGASPQLLLNWIFNASFLDQPSAFNVGLRYFALHKILLSPYHGVLFWTPVLFVAYAGLCLSARKGDWLGRALLAIMSIDLLVDGLCVSWWEGHSFGLRQTSGLWIAAAFGLLAWHRAARVLEKPWAPVARAVPVLCAVWTLGLFFRAVSGLELELPVRAGEILAMERGWLSGAADFLAWLWGRSKPGIVSFALLSALSAAAAYAASRYWRLVESGRWRPAAAIAGSVVLAANAALLWAHGRKTPLAVNPGERVMPAAELPRFFLEQALKNPGR